MEKKKILGLSPEGYHSLSYREYGQNHQDNVLITVHGLTRNGSDFHHLAQALQEDLFILSPDIVGRGSSGRLQDPKHYHYAQYLQDMNALIATTGANKVDWLGTSMGGLFGIIMAAMPNSPIRRLILNDIGPFVPKTAVDRIKEYASKQIILNDRQEAELLLRELYKPFGIQGQDQWDHVIDNSITKMENGQFTLAYDPGIAGAVEDDPHSGRKLAGIDGNGNVIFWDFWDRIKCPVLVINGQHSDILPQNIVEAMKGRGPSFDYFIVKDCGHAPALMAQDQIDHIKNWLKETRL